MHHLVIFVLRVYLHKLRCHQWQEIIIVSVVFFFVENLDSVFYGSIASCMLLFTF